MLSTLGEIVRSVLELILLKPVRWFASLDFFDTGLPLLVIVLIIVFYRPLSVAIMLAWLAVSEHLSNREWDGLWRSLWSMNQAQFDETIEDLEEAKQDHLDRADDLDEKALNRHFWFLPGSQRNMLRAADKRRAQAAVIGKHINELRKLWAEVLKERDSQESGREQIADLIARIGSADDRAAQSALAELNKLRHGPWLPTMSRKLPSHIRSTIENCLRLMAATNSLNEARSAHSRIAQVLRKNNLNWNDFNA